MEYQLKPTAEDRANLTPAELASLQKTLNRFEDAINAAPTSGTSMPKDKSGFPPLLSAQQSGELEEPAAEDFR